jgi:cysteine desulfurase family protein (TIGR01976 family)
MRAMDTPIDLSAVRARFPALGHQGPDGRPIIHADAPGGTQVPEQVIDAMGAYLRGSNANAHGGFPTSTATDELCARVRDHAAAFVGGHANGVVFGANMTTLTWHLARAVGRLLAPGDEIVCTRLDHDANVTPWVTVAERAGADVRWVGMDTETGTLRPADLADAVSERTRWVTFPAASNALGTVVPPRPFVEAARSVGARTFMDAVHAAPHVALDQAADGVDVLACSPYKFFGPHAGLVSASPDLLAAMVPDRLAAAPDHGPERWQTGTPNFEALAGVGAALDYLDEIGLDAIRAHELALSQRFLDGLDGLGHVTLHGTTDATQRTPTFAVTLADRGPAEASAHLAGRGIYTWAGHYYALEPMRALGLLERGGALRIGFVHYHGPDDVDRVLAALDELA